MRRFGIGVACREHVLNGVAAGSCQLCHGQAGPVRRMAAGDWLVHYSAGGRFRGEADCRRFAAIGEVVGAAVRACAMAPDFRPHRRDVRVLAAREQPIRPLIGQLAFIRDKSRWGHAFRFGYLEVSAADFGLIAEAMLGYDPSQRVPDR